MSQEYFNNRNFEGEKISTGTVENKQRLEATSEGTVTIEEPRLSEGISQFIYAGQVEGKAAKTLSQYDYVFEKFTTFIGKDPPLGEITPSVVRSFLKRLMDNKELSKATVAIHFRVIQAFFNWLVKEDLLEEAPTRNINQPKTPKKYPRVLNKEQTNKLIKTAKNNNKTWAGYRNYAVILTFLDTGLRLSELINAKLSDINFNERSLRVFGKGAKERMVFFGFQTYKALRRWMKMRDKKGKSLEGTIFISQNGERLKKRHVQRTVTRLQQKAGLEDTKVSPHVLRHTAATMAVKNGMGTFALKRFFGWESIDTAMKYVHLSDKSVKEAYNQASPIDALNDKK